MGKNIIRICWVLAVMVVVLASIAYVREVVADSAKAHFDLGVTYYQKGMYGEAITEFKKAIRVDPNYPEVHYRLGCAYREKGIDSKAMAEYIKEIELNRNSKAGKMAVEALQIAIMATYINGEHHYSIKYPRHWKIYKEDMQKKRSLVLFLSPPIEDTDVRVSVGVIAERLPLYARFWNVKNYYKSWQKRRREKANVISISPTPDKSGLREVYTYTEASPKREKRPGKGESAYFLRKGIGYRIIFSATEDTYGKAKEDFYRMLKTFVL